MTEADVADLRYSHDHLWVTVDAGTATLGVTPYIASQVGDPQFYTLPAVGATIQRGEVFAEIEAAKVICEVTAPVSGTVAEVNDRLEAEPAIVIDHPYEAWLVRLTDVDDRELSELLLRTEYQAYLSGDGVKHPLERRFGPPS